MVKFFNDIRNNIPSQKTKMGWKKPLAKIPSFIGEGQNAQHSIVTIVIISCFITAAVITILVVINYWCFRDCENKVPDIVGDLRIIWEIITPIITLALGYEFGKLEK